MCYDKTDYGIIRYPEKKNGNIRGAMGGLYMRRRDREVTELNEIIHILDSGKVLHLGLVDQGKPYIVPMNYGYVMER